MNDNDAVRAMIINLMETMTAVEIGRELNVSEGCVYRWRRGRNISQPNFVKLIRLVQRKNAGPVPSVPAITAPAPAPAPAIKTVATTKPNRYIVNVSYTVTADNGNDAVLEAISHAETLNIVFSTLSVHPAPIAPNHRGK